MEVVDRTNKVHLRGRFLGWLANLTLAASVLFAGAMIGRNLWHYLGPPSWGPRLVLQPNVCEIGTCALEERVKRSITLRNSGGAPLVIKEIITGCGCLVANLRDETIAPGAGVELEVILSPPKVGAFEKRVLVRSNDDRESERYLLIRGIVVKKG